MNCHREPYSVSRKSLAELPPISVNVAGWPYDVELFKKVTTGKRMCAAGLDLDFGPALSTRQSGDKT